MEPVNFYPTLLPFLLLFPSIFVSANRVPWPALHPAGGDPSLSLSWHSSHFSDFHFLKAYGLFLCSHQPVQEGMFCKHFALQLNVILPLMEVSSFLCTSLYLFTYSFGYFICFYILIFL